VTGNRPAIVLATRAGADQVVGGLPLAARAVLALARAGFEDIAVLAPGSPAWLRRPLEARGTPVTWLAGADDARAFLAGAAATDPVVLLDGDVLLDPEGAQPLHRAGPGPVAGPDGPQPIALVSPAGEVPARLAGRAGRPGVEPADGETRPGAARAATGAGLALPLGAAGSAAVLEARLLEALGKTTVAQDGYLATAIDRRLSRPLTRLLLWTPLAPSHVTVLSIVLGIAGAVGLATTSYAGRLAGVCLLVGSTVLDCVDGELARARHEQSAGGAWLDLAGDYVVNLAAFVGLVTGLLRQGLPPGGAWAAWALAGGLGAAMLTVHLLFIRPALRHGDLHWRGDARSLRGTRGAAVAERLASRDYTYVLLALALLGHLEWFLYAAAAGSWAFVAAVLAWRSAAGLGRRREASSA
jgi:phosphatidylglycerophosphate synthase